MELKLESVVFYLKEEWRHKTQPEAEEAVRSYGQYGIDARIRYCLADDMRAPLSIPWDALCITDSGAILRDLAGQGAAVCAYRHGANEGEDLRGADYILMEPQWVDADSLTKIWQRQRHLPWSILETERCLVREFVPDDLDGIYALYDEQASRFLEPPSDDRAKEREILCSYIEKMYPLCGYGHWAVIGKESGELIGRMGFSFRPAEWAGPEIDACFGYLLRADRRGRGITGEVCRALLEYGFMQLGFEVIGADASVFNSISVKILKSFGFETVAERGDQRYYILNKRNWRNRT